MRVLFSACLAGVPCGVDGTPYGACPDALAIRALANVKAVEFCPEDFAFGTPRALPDLHGGNGFDVLDGRARVRTDGGEDWTEGFLEGAREMLRRAEEARIDLAILQNMSAACGTQVVSDGCRLVEERRFQVGPGVATAALLRAGFVVVNALDRRTLELLRRALDPSHVVDTSKRNYDESDWYRARYGAPSFGRDDAG